MSSELLAILILTVVHVVAIGVLLAMLLGDDGPLRGWWPRDDSDGGGPSTPHDPTSPGPPLGESEPAPIRLRGPGRLADAHAIPRRRSVEPEPGRAPAGTPIS